MRVRRVESESTRVDDEARAAALFLGNAVLLALVQALIRLDVQPGVNRDVLTLFTIGELVILAGYFFQLGSRLLTQLPRQFGEWDEDDELKGDEEADRLYPLWVPVVLNFVPIAYLIHETGGPVQSPYAGVPAAMLIIGQLLKNVQPVQRIPRRHLWRKLVVGAVREFYAFILLAVVFYGLLLVWQGTGAAHPGQAPAGMAVAVTALLFSASTLTNYFARALRRQLPPKDGPTEQAEGARAGRER